MVEELLVGESSIARDIKCYSFYGEVGLILETKRMPQIERCWYDADLNYVDIGKYSNRLFKGSRDDLLELIKVANKLSSELPSPFVRIDFLYCNGQFYVGEFTPLPGSFWIINQEWDEKLGVLFGQASVRLAHDISLGKIFNNYLATPKTEALAMDLIKSQID
ncbi:ATP-grasp fold amidoligase family protein [Ignatzschineria cameli]|uniref:ATP-grasp domain-containing protein n=1 Tax=Ignatzschineria cameli TaxID=2182793 RepID=A0A2U2ASM9_9GAMM|nr:hypothetical protein DC077_00195 [Ignatzschineria cameli]